LPPGTAEAVPTFDLFTVIIRLPRPSIWMIRHSLQAVVPESMYLIFNNLRAHIFENVKDFALRCQKNASGMMNAGGLMLKSYLQEPTGTMPRKWIQERGEVRP
jgi:hypothetical protein